MGRLRALAGSTIGQKAAMAVSGLMLFGFIVGHMTGNLKAFQGPETYNAYAAGLRTLGEPLLGYGQFLLLARAGLLAAVIIHIAAAARLTLLARAARPVGYRQAPHLETSFASRTMRWGGVILLLYVVYHLMHFTWGNAHPNFIPGDVYHNLVTGFQSVPVVVVYLAAQVALALHLYHGVWSALQTLGANGPAYSSLRRAAAGLFALAVWLGFSVVPLAVQAGLIR